MNMRVNSKDISLTTVTSHILIIILHSATLHVSTSTTLPECTWWNQVWSDKLTRRIRVFYRSSIGTYDLWFKIGMPEFCVTCEKSRICNQSVINVIHRLDTAYSL